MQTNIIKSEIVVIDKIFILTKTRIGGKKSNISIAILYILK